MSEDKKRWLKTNFGPEYLEVIFIALMIAAAAILCYDNYMAQEIYFFDLKGYLRTQKALLAAGEINEEEWRANLDRVEHILNDKAVDPKHVILLKDVVLRNGKEIIIKESR